MVLTTKNMKRRLGRGEVVWVNLDPTVGGEIKKRRPCLILSKTSTNEQRLTVVIIPLSSTGTPRLPFIVALPSISPRTNARIDQIRAVDKSRIGEVLGTITRTEMATVEEAMRVVLEL